MIMVDEIRNPIRDAAARRLRELDDEIRDVEAYLLSLKRQRAIAAGASLTYSGMRIKNAIYMFLDEKGPQTRDSIISQLNSGGVSAGKRQAESQVGKSIDRLLRAGKLRKVGDKIDRAK
jgi:hypothetical protein